MSDRKGMRDGVVQRGATWSYVLRVKVPVVDEAGQPVLDDEGNARMTTKPKWFGGFSTRKAAVAARDEARHGSRQGTWVAPSNITVGAYLDRWIEGHAVDLKASTEKSYRGNIARYLKPYFGNLRVQELSPTDLSATFKRMHETGGTNGKPLSPRTVAFARTVLRMAMQAAISDRVIAVNPVVGSKLPKAVRPKHSTWTGPQASAYLEHVKDERFAALWILALATGMRRGELCALRWENVDLKAGVVRVEESVTQSAGLRTIGPPKNGDGRSVAIDPRTVAALKAWRKQQRKERLAAGSIYKDTDGVVFTWQDGTPTPPDYVSKAFVDSQAEAGLPRLKLHEARHTHATILLREGTPVHIVSKRLGHRDPTVTLSVYADVIPEDDGHAVDIFTKAVWGS